MRDLTLANRIVVSPMAQYSATPEGHATPWHLMHVGNLAVSGAGLVIMEATAVEPRGRVSPRCLGLWTDAQAEALRPVVDSVARRGKRRSASNSPMPAARARSPRPWEGNETVPPEAGGWRPVSSCELAYPGRPVPQMLSLDEMDEIKAGYVAAARRADALGFDLIELHAAHGYLLNCFLSPLANRRNDAYGGDLLGRMRWPLEIFAALRGPGRRASRSGSASRRPIGRRMGGTRMTASPWPAR
ncbi:hypothetical protein [Dankookia sp. P2]|uniref:oxidoreductase n=1 Tax=Dankookia sp. P2 TaxID=3423955 RepID=UPI003D66EFA5